MTIDTREAMQYLYDRFTLSGEAQRMASALLDYVDEHRPADAQRLILHVFDGFGFEAEDLDRWKDTGIFRH